MPHILVQNKKQIIERCNKRPEILQSNILRIFISTWRARNDHRGDQKSGAKKGGHGEGGAWQKSGN